MRRTVCHLVVLGTLCVARSAWALDITTCGQVVPAHGTGVLQADLVDCDHFAVRLEDRAMLQMNGHAILGSIVFSIECIGKRCSIVGPGEIADGGGVRGDGGISHSYHGRGRPRMVLSDLNIHDNGSALVSFGRVIATNVVVHHNVTTNQSVTGPPVDSIALGAFRLDGTNLQVTDNRASVSTRSGSGSPTRWRPGTTATRWGSTY